MDSDLAQQVAELARRLDRLEGNKNAPAFPAAVADESHVTYSGTGPWCGGEVRWQIIRGWGNVLAETDGRSAALFSSLSSPSRLRIVGTLMSGQMTTSELARRLDQPSTGQLFHHLKELLAAGVIHQPVRGTYAIRAEHAVPLMAMMCAALDLGRPAPGETRDPELKAAPEPGTEQTAGEGPR
jgi:hypothetical protein